MKYKIEHQGNFKIVHEEEILENGIKILHVKANNTGAKEKLNFSVSWAIPTIGVHTVWAPGKYKDKEIVPDWGAYEKSCAMSSAPVFSDVSYDDRNKQTIACSDAKNTVEIHTGVIEETSSLDSVVKIRVDHAVSDYEVDIRIDQRDIPFYDALDEVRAWWETYEGYEAAEVPAAAYDPVYSTWYSFHQDVNVAEIVKQCEAFAKLGCKTIIVDDGWQTDNNLRGYEYCGDWKVAPSKIADMKAFVDAVHQTGMKFMLWYSVPYIGAQSEAYKRFKDKLLCRREENDGEAYVVDPRYPEVREYLIGLYKQAVLEWGLDGFKLDFVDAFKQSDVVKEGMDYVSVYDAVDRLLKDVIRTLKELKPDILIEFRQTYIGPLMRTFGNMFRSMDCPCDSWSNGLNTLALRMTSGDTAPHSDMVMWNYNDTAEEAAFQLTRILFAVPQISVRAEWMTDRQRSMVKRYLQVWNQYRDVLMKGEMLYKGYAYNYPYVSARKEQVQVGAVYMGGKAYIEVPTEEIVLFNATLDDEMLIHVKDAGNYQCSVYDCCGVLTAEYEVNLDHSVLLTDIPVNGTMILTKHDGEKRGL